jgi:hypothetical protein
MFVHRESPCHSSILSGITIDMSHISGQTLPSFVVFPKLSTSQNNRPRPLNEGMRIGCHVTEARALFSLHISIRKCMPLLTACTSDLAASVGPVAQGNMIGANPLIKCMHSA